MPESDKGEEKENEDGDGDGGWGLSCVYCVYSTDSFLRNFVR
jgi:hypothetical protein